eukprot:gene12968-biopygen69
MRKQDAVRDAGPEITKAYTAVHDLWVYFQRSSERLRSLDEMHDAMRSPHYRIHAPGDTRWLYHSRAFDSVCRDLRCLVPAVKQLHEEDGDSSSAGLIVLYSQQNTIAGVHLCRDVLAITSRMCEALQSKELTLIQVPRIRDRALGELMRVVNNIKCVNGIKRCVSRWNQEWPVEYERITGKKPTDADMDRFWVKVACPYVQLVVFDIANRLNCGEVVGALGIFDPKAMPFSNDEVLATYGDKEISTIMRHFAPEEEHCAQGSWHKARGQFVDMVDHGLDAGFEDWVVVGHCEPVVNAAECICTWPSFRNMMADGLRNGDFDDLESFLRWYLSGSIRRFYPDLTKLLLLIATLPVGSCSNERSFSTMKLIKNRLRSMLSDANLEWLMIAGIEGPDKLSPAQVESVLDAFKAMKQRSVPM